MEQLTATMLKPATEQHICTYSQTMKSHYHEPA